MAQQPWSARKSCVTMRARRRLWVSRGMLINDADIPLFRAKIQQAGLYGQWRAQFGAEAFGQLEQAVGKLA